MKTIRSLSLILLSLTFSCCISQKETFWVSGIKTNCTQITDSAACLEIYQGDKPEEAEWQSFSSPIAGFVFEEGYTKRIKVQKNKNEEATGGAPDGFTLIKELDKKKDKRLSVNGQWLLASIKGQPLNRMVTVPTLHINLVQKQISGNSGCNSYHTVLKNINTSTITFGQVTSTKKACINKNIEQEFLKIFQTIYEYQVEGDKLIFFNKSKDEILTFLKKQDTPPYQLNDIWVVTHLYQKELEKTSTVPRLEVRFKEQKVNGTDGCNQFSGEIKTIGSSEISFGNLISTRKFCHPMETADLFNKALQETQKFELKGTSLLFFDQNGKEIIRFLKTD